MEDAKKEVVLIVDDAPTNIQTLAGILNDDYTLKVATGGKQALKLVKQEPFPDLILLDVQMPDMNGFDVCKHLKQDEATKNIPVIFVTGNTSDGSEELGLKLGAVDYITKPIRPSIVKARVKTHITLKLFNDSLFELAMHDGLTSLYNRNFLFTEAKRIFSHSRRKMEKFSVIMLDIDHFKSVNDTYGHQVGDDVLKVVASVLHDGTRTEDIAARFGGEEFVLVLYDCDKEMAKEKAEKLRLTIESLDINGVKVTSSFGITEIKEEHIVFDDMIKDADTALYKAKESGRNKVVVQD